MSRRSMSSGLSSIARRIGQPLLHPLLVSREILPPQKCRDRSAGCHELARRRAAHDIEMAVLTERLLDGELDDIRNRSEIAARATRTALGRHLRPHGPAIAAASAGPAERVVDRESHHAL